MRHTWKSSDLVYPVIGAGLVVFALVMFPAAGAWSDCAGNSFTQLSTNTVTANGQYGFAGAWFCVNVPKATTTVTTTLTVVQSSTTVEVVTTGPHLGSIQLELFGLAPGSATFTYTGHNSTTIRTAALASGSGFWTASDESVPAGTTSATLTYGSSSQTVSFGPTAFQSFSWGYAWEA